MRECLGELGLSLGRGDPEHGTNAFHGLDRGTKETADGDGERDIERDHFGVPVWVVSFWIDTRKDKRGNAHTFRVLAVVREMGGKVGWKAHCKSFFFSKTFGKFRQVDEFTHKVRGFLGVLLSGTRESLKNHGLITGI